MLPFQQNLTSAAARGQPLRVTRAAGGENSQPLARGSSPLATGSSAAGSSAARPSKSSSPPALPPASADILRQLTQEIRQLETATRATGDTPAISSGCAALDALLPHGGYLPGCLVEYLRATPGCGASSLALAAAAAALKASGGFLVVVDTHHNFYPPALLSHGIDLTQVIWVRPQSPADALWAVDQALRTGAVAAVVADLERIDDRAARRLQLAAECGSGLGLLLRSAAARKQPSWAEVQWLIRSRPYALNTTSVPMRSQGQRGLLVQLTRLRGGRAGASVGLEIDALTGKLQLAKVPAEKIARQSDETTRNTSQSAVHLASQLAHPTDRRRRAAAG